MLLDELCDKINKIEKSRNYYMKLLASDYDGTLRYGQDVMKEDIEALREWKNGGNLFVIVTGRSYESIDAQIKKHQIPVDYVITNNGGMVFDKEGKILLSQYLDYDVCIQILHHIKQYDLVVSYVVNDGIHRHRIVLKPDVEDHRYPNLNPDLTEAELLDMGHFAQIVLSMPSVEASLDIAKKINALYYEKVVAYPNNFVVDIVPKDVSKASGMEFLSHFVEVDMKNIYTIGDGYNDIPLIGYGLNGSVMAWADGDVKIHAKKEYNSICEMIKDIK